MRIQILPESERDLDLAPISTISSHAGRGGISSFAFSTISMTS